MEMGNIKNIVPINGNYVLELAGYRYGDALYLEIQTKRTGLVREPAIFYQASTTIYAHLVKHDNVEGSIYWDYKHFASNKDLSNLVMNALLDIARKTFKDKKLKLKEVT